MNHWHSQRFLSEAKKASSVSSAVKNAATTGQAILKVNDRTAVLFTLRHLAHEADVPYDLLRRVVARAEDDGETFYRVFTRKKKDVGHAPGRVRTICAPHPLLLKAQRWIHDNILKHGRFHEASCAYRPDSRITAAASIHCNAKWMVKVDVTNFFESIYEPSVYKAFRSFGYQPLMAFELTRLSTRLRRGAPKVRTPRPQGRICAYSSSAMGHLPQGAPTSPLLANLVAYHLDEEMAALAQLHGMKYTRYADDITLSTDDQPWSRAHAVALLNSAHAILERHGFWPNHAKAKIVPPGTRKVVLGLAVQDDIPRLTRDFRNTLRARIHYLARFFSKGTAPHDMLGFDSMLGLQRHVFGLAYFAIGIEPEWGRARLAELKALPWPTADGIVFDGASRGA